MKSIIRYLMVLVLSTCLVQAAFAEKINWINYSDSAISKAIKSKRNILIFAMSDTCHWCHLMQSTTLKDPTVIKAINDNFYPVMLHADMNAEIDQKYNITGVPVMIFLDTNGNVIKTFDGFEKSDQLLKNIDETMGLINKKS